MRKLWIRRRGVSTMIGGVIVLGLFLTALAAMILLTQYYDAYQQTVNKVKQSDMERFSENLRGVDLVKQNPVSCTGTTGQCNKYTMMISDLTVNGSVNIGFQIGRIYLNTSQPAQPAGCTAICILNPSKFSNPPVQFTFDAYASYVNPGEFEHNVTLWLPSSITLPNSTGALNTITIVTTRGRQFSFPWPALPTPPPAAGSGGGAGGTGLFIGPLVITFQKTLITYSKQAGQVQYPILGNNGGWVIPQPNLIIYLKIQTDAGTPNNVYLTAQSVLELAQFDNPGAVDAFYIVAPITQSFCKVFNATDPTIICSPSYGYSPASCVSPSCIPGNTGDANAIVAYLACNTIPYSSCPLSLGYRYMIPRPTTQQLQNGERGDPVIVAFAARAASGSAPQTGNDLNQGKFVTSFLGLTYVYNDNTGIGDYTYAVTLPFMAMCIDNGGSATNYCGI
jgi:hypothetical protein